MKSILFVCLGNICRSPMAEAIFADIVEKKGTSEQFHIDSAGLIGYHEGERADERMNHFAFQRGYYIGHRSRPIVRNDFYDFDLIIGMDHDNIEHLEQLRPKDAKSEIRLMTDYCRNIKADVVPDPYYGGAAGFTYVIDVLEDACSGLYDEVCGL